MRCGIVTTDAEPAGVSRAIGSVPRQRAFLMSRVVLRRRRRDSRAAATESGPCFCEAHFAAFAACPPLGFVDGRVPYHTRLGVTRSCELSCGHKMKKSHLIDEKKVVQPDR